MHTQQVINTENMARRSRNKKNDELILSPEMVLKP